MRNFLQGFAGSAGAVFVIVCALLVNKTYEQSSLHLALTLPKQENSEYQQYVLNDAELNCLSDNMFYEARNQGDIGMLMVGFVTMHRVFESKNKTICGVVHAHGECNFSWTCTKKKQEVNLNNFVTRNAYERAKVLSIALLVGQEKDFTNGANFYHTTKVHPYWSHAKGFTYVGQVNDHKLYRYEG